MNYFYNDKTNQYFDIRTNSLNKILEKKKEQYSICNLRFLKYLRFLSGQNAHLYTSQKLHKWKVIYVVETVYFGD